MPTPTYTPLATVTLGASASSVTFSSIPATYRDLILVAAANSTNSGMTDNLYRFNGDTGNNYFRVGMFGSVTPASGSFSNTSVDAAYISTMNGTAIGTNTYTPAVVSFLDYSATDKHKTSLHRYGTSADSIIAAANRWANTAAVTTLLCFPRTGSFNTGSTFSLYGVIA